MPKNSNEEEVANTTEQPTEEIVRSDEIIVLDYEPLDDASDCLDSETADKMLEKESIDSFAEGYEEGYDSAYVDAYEKGREESAESIAYRMIELHTTEIEKISRLTGLPSDKVRNLVENHRQAIKAAAREEGRYEEARRIAGKLKTLGITSDSHISDLTGIPLDQVARLSKYKPKTDQ